MLCIRQCFVLHLAYVHSGSTHLNKTESFWTLITLCTSGHSSVLSAHHHQTSGRSSNVLIHIVSLLIYTDNTIFVTKSRHTALVTLLL